MRGRMDMFNRYAVYAAPQPGPLADFAARWLGWDPVAGEAVAHPEVSGLPRPVEALTASPRKYGFHCTLKPPFRLADGSSRAALEADLADLAATLPAVVLDGLGLHRVCCPKTPATRGSRRTVAAEVWASASRPTSVSIQACYTGSPEPV